MPLVLPMKGLSTGIEPLRFIRRTLPKMLSSACELEESPHIDSYRKQLTELYLSFSEGSDTADLVKASERCRIPAAAQSSA